MTDQPLPCDFKSILHGQCQQPRRLSGLCWYHEQPREIHDEFYHKKVILGLLQPTHEYLDQVEVDALFDGRRRNDGRRLDHYVES
jgi:hypothetical protein